MTEGRQAWIFFERDGISDALTSALEFYADAYRIHPRNREAVSALNEAADALLSQAKTDEERREYARYLQLESDHFRKYPPVVDAAR